MSPLASTCSARRKGPAAGLYGSVRQQHADERDRPEAVDPVLSREGRANAEQVSARRDQVQTNQHLAAAAAAQRAKADVRLHYTEVRAPIAGIAMLVSSFRSVQAARMTSFVSALALGGLTAWNFLSVTGWGLWLVIAAGVVALLAPFMIARDRS